MLCASLRCCKCISRHVLNNMVNIAERRSFTVCLRGCWLYSRCAYKEPAVGANCSFVASLVVMIALVIPPTKKMATLKPTFD